MKKVEMIISYTTDGTDFLYCDNHGVLTRCEGCKHWKPDDVGTGVCQIEWYPDSNSKPIYKRSAPDYFCALGEPKA